MIHRIHILGASGSGTTTLGRELSLRLGFCHFDTDNYYWLPSDPPYQQKREIPERLELLKNDLEGKHNWILTGSLCGWGDIFIPLFDLVVFLWIPKDIRVRRLIEREAQRYGKDAICEGGPLHEKSKAFVEWASQYDTGGIEIRSRLMHDRWMEKLLCPVIKLEGDLTVEKLIKSVVDRINA